MAAFSRIPSLYIADGHHRAASAARARTEIARSGKANPLGDGADFNTMLAVAFPHDQVQVLAYNRVVRDLAGMSVDQFLTAGGSIQGDGGTGGARRRAAQISMYLDGSWHTLVPKIAPDPNDAIAALDVSVLQDSLLAPILRIADVRTDKRIDFVGGARGTAELERHVDSGQVRGGVFSLSRLGGRPHGGVRRARHHAAQVDLVRAEAARRPSPPRDLTP